jgi:hypothetical protein
MGTQTFPEFRHVLHIHDETSNQTFFINTTLLRSSCQGTCILGDGEDEEDLWFIRGGWTDCVSLEIPPVLVSADTSFLLRITEAQASSCRWHDNLNSNEYGTTLSGTSP